MYRKAELTRPLEDPMCNAHTPQPDGAESATVGPCLHRCAPPTLDGLGATGHASGLADSDAMFETPAST
jgi:hypothetical protein